MKKFDDELLTMNLQFFADEDGEGSEGATEVEAAELPEGESEGEVSTEEGVTEEAAAPQMQSPETNAAFANMRRELEASRRQQQELDAMYKRNYGHLVNPETGQPINGARDYYEALAAQDRVNARAQMQQNGIDPSIIDNMIANSPAVREAKAATAELNSIRANQMMEEDFRQVLSLDPSKSSVEDIINDPSYGAVVDYCSRVPGMRFTDAYKLVNFDRLSKSQAAAAKQAVVNQVKGQGHLSTGGGISTNSSDEDIPASMVNSYKELFPGKTMAELKALYNRTIQNRR